MMRRLIVNVLVFMFICSVVHGKDETSIEEPSGDIEVITRSGAILPFQFAIVEQLQLISQDRSITGLKINFVYGSNYSINGVDLGIISKVQYSKAVQLNLMTIVEKEGYGFQVGLFNLAQSYSGMQLGVFNLCGTSFAGLQTGFFNLASVCSGVQIGVVNNCRTMQGVQVGVINIIKDNKLPCLPLVNMSF